MFEGIVLDIDDTLIKEGEINIEDIHYISSLKKKGYQIILATGRSLDETRNIAEKMCITTPLILLQGSLIYYGSGKMYQTPISKTAIIDVIRWCKYNKIDFQIVTKDDSYLLESHNKLENNFEYQEVLQIIIEFKNNVEKKKTFEKFFEDRLDMLIRIHEDIDVCMSIDIDKGLALRHLAYEMGWDLSKFIAIGNFPSDRNMFDETGYSIVIENKKEMEETKNVQLISNASVSIALEELLSKIATYEGVRYRKNLKFRIRSFGEIYYCIGENEIERMDRLIFDLWREIKEDVCVTEIIKSLNSHYNILKILEGLEFLTNKTIIERR